MADLKDLRKKIDNIDRQLVELFESRMKLSADVAEYKKGTGSPIYDSVREAEKIEAIKEMTKDDYNKLVIGDLFTQIMTMSRGIQYKILNTSFNLGFDMVDHLPVDKNTKVLFYGEKGSYTEQAMKDYFKTDIVAVAMETFEGLVEAINDSQGDYGILPIENSSTGSLSDIYDLLAMYDNYIIGEHVIKVEHNLWGLPGSKLSDINKVYSHRQGLLQCSDFFKENPGLKAIEGTSTAACARKVLENQDKSQAAIASKVAGEKYGLELLEEKINNDNTNSTRFIIISNKSIYTKNAKRTSICFETPHRSGALYHMLSHLIYNKLNMTRIESRPIPGKAFQYRFFVDIEGTMDDPAVKNALYCIKEEAIDLKILGSF